jgi:sec-independent protein translocase protein TatB
MFDVGFSEMVVIAIVALIVIGPERLPGVARTVGALLGRLRRYVGDVKAEVNRELQLEEIRKMQQQLAEQASRIEQTVHKEAAEAVEIRDAPVPATALESVNVSAESPSAVPTQK